MTCSPVPEQCDDCGMPASLDPLWLSEARYRAIVEDQPDLVCRFLPDGTLTFVNAAYCRYFNVRREDVIGRRYHPIVHPDDVKEVERRVAELSPESPVVFVVNRVTRGDGALRWTEWSNRALYDEQGRQHDAFLFEKLVKLMTTSRYKARAPRV